jgi:uncharacterized 2Fe-2S/4Fe-4S cluster protein (DUF4445 family)
VSTLTKVERELLTAREIENGVRLSCQAGVEGNTICRIPQESQLFGDQIMVDGQKGRFPLHPDIRKILLAAPEPHLGEKYFDLETVLSEISRILRIDKNTLTYNFPIVHSLPKLLRENKYQVTVVIDRHHILVIEPGNTTASMFGVAFDIGTTTVAAKLLDLTTGRVMSIAAAVNSQKAHGADVISRINYTVEHQGGLQLMHHLILKQMNDLVIQLCGKLEITPTSIYKSVVVGNTVMQHFVLGIDPRNVAFAPHTPPFQGPVTLSASHLGLHLHEQAVVYFPGNLASFVGSDITAVLTVLDIDDKERTQLVVDIGTNGEMVLSTKGKMLCCSSPAGPAWEGAYIQWGMRAARGAIERAEIVHGYLELRTIGNAEPMGICGSGLLDLVCEFVRAGLIDISGRILAKEEIDKPITEDLLKRIISLETGVNDLTIHHLHDEKHILLTQKDIREVQLAKAAIAAGIKILMKELHIIPGMIDAVFIAGAFGNHVRGRDAVDIGLIPHVDEERIRFIGNAALSGAEAILLSREGRERSEHICRSVGYVEVSGRMDFQDIFVDSMHFPYKP